LAVSTNAAANNILPESNVKKIIGEKQIPVKPPISLFTTAEFAQTKFGSTKSKNNYYTGNKGSKSQHHQNQSVQPLLSPQNHNHHHHNHHHHHHTNQHQQPKVLLKKQKQLNKNKISIDSFIFEIGVILFILFHLNKNFDRFGGICYRTIVLLPVGNGCNQSKYRYRFVLNSTCIFKIFQTVCHHYNRNTFTVRGFTDL
jgi:hypothetical protein